jgi:plastocyanin
MRMKIRRDGIASRLRRRDFLAGLGVTGAVTLVACSSSPSPTPTPAAASSSSSSAASAGTTIQMTNDNKFSPAEVTVAKGSAVTWQNASTMVHTTTDDPSKAVNKSDAALPSGAQPWDSGLLQPGQSWTHTFDVAGTYSYFCIPHETLGMLGKITVQ